MEIKNLKLLLLTNNQMILSQIDEVSTDLGEPDCKLTEPFVVGENDTLSPWLLGYTNQNTFMIHSDKILTIVEPNAKLEKKYEGMMERE